MESFILEDWHFIVFIIIGQQRLNCFRVIYTYSIPDSFMLLGYPYTISRSKHRV